MFLGGLVFLTCVMTSFHGINNDKESTINMHAKVTFRELGCFLSWLKVSHLVLSSRKSVEFSITNGAILLLSAGAKNGAKRAVILFLKPLNSSHPLVALPERKDPNCIADVSWDSSSAQRPEIPFYQAFNFTVRWRVNTYRNPIQSFMPFDEQL